MVQDMGAGLDEREQAGTKQDASLKNMADNTKENDIHAKTANTKAKHKNGRAGAGAGAGQISKCTLVFALFGLLLEIRSPKLISECTAPTFQAIASG